MSAAKSFSTSAKRAAGTQKPMPFYIDYDPADGSNVIRYDFVAQTPNQDQMVLFALIDFEDEDEVQHSLQMLFDFLGGVVGSAGRRRMEKAIGAGHISMEMLVGGEGSVLAWLLEQWGNFPTQPSSDSSSVPAPTGKRSTGRLRSTASTPSSSPSTGS